MVQVSRRTLLIGSTTTAFATSLGACVPQQPVSASVGSAAVLANAPPPEAEVGEQAVVASDERQVMGRGAYGPVPGERFPVPAAPLSRINPAFLRARVAYASSNKPGTIVEEHKVGEGAPDVDSDTQTHQAANPMSSAAFRPRIWSFSAEVRNEQ